ncbi:MAG: hypothetical protein JWQ37_2902 [Blastococcus sp.]|nr:hypothetical protein [Blastococcus sp.]
MDYKTFIDTEAQRAGLPKDQAETVAHATLKTLADRITGGEAGDLAAQLPNPLKGDLQKEQENAEAFDVGEFVRRVSERAHVDQATARNGAMATLITVREAVTPGEFDDITSQLPQDYRELVGPMS